MITENLRAMYMSNIAGKLNMFNIASNIAGNIAGNITSKIVRCECLYFLQFSNVLLENLLSVDGSATQLPAILLAILLDVYAPMPLKVMLNTWYLK